MALGKVQSLIIAKLIAMGRLTAEQRDSIASRPQDLNGDALDRLLQEDFKITAFQCLVAKGRALGLAPFNVSRYKIVDLDVRADSAGFLPGEPGSSRGSGGGPPARGLCESL